MLDFSRRELLMAGAARTALGAAAGAGIDAALVRRHDAYVDALLARQETRPGAKHQGGLPDAYGIFFAGSPAGLLEAGVAAWMTAESRHHRSAALMERMRMAAGWLDRHQQDSGNFDLPATNFNSPPDTAFLTHPLGGAAILAKRHGVEPVSAAIEPVLRRIGSALTVGGVHTPNHRWVICEALSQLYELFGEPAYLRRIDQWLAEGIDIDADGQYNERSTTIYNAVSNRALTVIACKLKRWELLEPVRRNLQSMLWLLHPNGEVVTEISSRQDANERGDIGRYWFPLRFLALCDANGRLATLASRYEERHASLPLYLQYPELQGTLPVLAPLPNDYVRLFPELSIARIRRGERDASIIHNGNSRIFTMQHGECVVNAVRLASAFFGKGQFMPTESERTQRGFRMTQSLEGPYYQPLEPSRPVAPREYGDVRGLRRKSEICRMNYDVRIGEIANGFELEITAEGTRDVPLAIEISLRDEARIEGCVEAPNAERALLLKDGFATVRSGTKAIRFGPGLGEHAWTRLRGTLPQLPGTSVYLCGLTPLQRTLRFECL